MNIYVLPTLLALSIPFLSCIHDRYKNFSNEILEDSVNMTLIHQLAKMETEEFVEFYGYPCETHEVVTEDGYILKLHHVLRGRNEADSTKNKTIVFLQHGFFQTSRDWFGAGPEKALGFILADAGYDVWAGNSRGNVYSRNHITIDPNDNKFWNFSFHESGVYDMPACIDYVLDYQQQQTLVYIGYSQGTTVFFTMLSEFPEYNDKIKLAFTMAPVAYMSHLRGSTQSLFQYCKTLLTLGDYLGVHEVSTVNWPLTKFVTNKICDSNYLNHLCINKMFEFCGYSLEEFNATLLPIVTYHYPAGSSLKSVLHFYQEYKSGNFCYYDYGTALNQEYYGTPVPPKYNLKNVKVQIHLLYGLNDYFSNEEDVQRLYAELPEGNKQIYLIPHDQWTHMDYMYGIDADKLVYSYLMHELINY